ncbi:MAG TPA: O-antigen ligase family protein [Vicinamibacterales bacterium]|nr:O-antigen ligase family protein [Vicinamibacterales bacterium]
MIASEATTAWWRPERAAPSGLTAQPGGRLAFGALFAFTGILILSPQAWFPAFRSLRIALLAAGVAIIAHLLGGVIRRRPGQRHPEVVIAFCLAAWAVLTVPISLWPGGSVSVLTDLFLKAIVFFWLIGVLVTTGPRLRMFLRLLVVCSIPLAVTAIRNYRSGVFLEASGAVMRIAGYNVGGSGLTENPNDMALMLNLLIPFAAALLAIERRLAWRVVAASALLLSIAAVVATFSRAGFLTLVAIGIVGLVTMARRRPVAALGIVLVLAASSPLIPRGYLERLSTITNISSDPTGSSQGRWTDLTVAAEFVARHPLTGVGLGQNVLALNRERGPTWREVHNVYLQYAVDLGLPGLALFLWLFVALFRAAGRVRRLAVSNTACRDVGIVAGGVQVALVGFAVAAMFHPVAYQFYFFCIAGLALAVKNVFSAAVASSRLAQQPV